MDDDQDFKYDVALSFLAQDEPLALQFSGLIQATLPTFLYSDRQRELAGKDGEQEFARVFRAEARLVVVLYRRGWGETRWTRVEESAIRSRGFDHGYDFALFISLDGTSPEWLPRQRLWLNLERFGVAAAVAVIEARVQDAGGSSRPETAEEKLKQVAHALRTEAERKRLLASDDGVAAANAEVERLFTELEHSAAAAGARFEVERAPREFVLRVSGLAIGISWHIAWSNTLDESGLGITLWEGRKSLRPGIPISPPRSMRNRMFTFDVAASGDPLWREGRKAYSTAGLAHECVDMLLRELERRRR